MQNKYKTPYHDESMRKTGLKMHCSHALIVHRVAVRLWKTEKLGAEDEHFSRTKQQNPAVPTTKPNIHMYYVLTGILSWQ